MCIIGNAFKVKEQCEKFLQEKATGKVKEDSSLKESFCEP